jgi:hypothetical protein
MRDQAPWRSLQSVMLLAIHVAVIASVFRFVTGPDRSQGSIVWVVVMMAAALFFSWPISRAIAGAFDPVEVPAHQICPKCRRADLRPLVRHGAGLFQPVSNYRCAGCWTTFRLVGEAKIVEPAPSRMEPVDPAGIRFLDEVAEVGEIRFLDDPGQSPA